MPCPRAQLIERYCRENTTAHREGFAPWRNVARPHHHSHHPARQDTARCRRRATSLLNADEAAPHYQAPWPQGGSLRRPEAHTCRQRPTPPTAAWTECTVYKRLGEA